MHNSFLIDKFYSESMLRNNESTVTETLLSATSTLETVITAQDLLLALDTCNRSDNGLISNTISELRRLAQENGESAESMVKLALVTAFKRRNHNKSQAEGEGAGEILIFIKILLAVVALGSEFEEMVKSILPLVHVYGSWKDLRVLAEKMVEEQLIRHNSDKQSVELNEVCKLICRIFAEQLIQDQIDMETKTPSNACKYVPHYSRHFHQKPAGGKRKRNDADDDRRDSDAEPRARRDAPAAGRGGRGGRGGRCGDRGGRREGRGGRARGRDRRDVATLGAAVEAMETTSDASPVTNTVEESRSVANIANRILADEICRIACPREFAQKRGKAAFRKLRAGLNRQLVAKGHLVEPLLCAKELSKINFARACKGSLMMYTKAIKREGLSARWMAQMKKNSSAVPDLNQIDQAVRDYQAELTAPDGEELKMFDLRLAKAIKSAQESREKLVENARKVQQARLLSGGEANLGAAETVVGVVVDTAMCEDHDARMSLVLAAFILAKAQGMSHIAIDGVVHSLDPAVPPAAALENEGEEVNEGDEDGESVEDGEEGEAAAPTGPVEVIWSNLVPSRSASSDGAIRRFTTGSSALLAALQNDPTVIAANGATCDLIFMCYDFAAYNDDKGAVHDHIAALQTAAPTTSTQGPSFSSCSTTTPAAAAGLALRTLRVHRMRYPVGASGEDFDGAVPYEPRRGLRALPADVSQITADLAFVVDFTGSMGSYMTAVKTQLVRVINAIQHSVRCKHIRVALVGYRDYKDTDRVVIKDFTHREDLPELLRVIAGQQAGGGGDSPEDLLSGLVAVNTLSWSSDIRLQVIITDANAHGYNSYVEGDYYPSGKCPDQAADASYPSLPQIMATLAHEKLVDTFFCQLNESTLKTLNVIAEAYTDGRRGFGTLTLDRQASDFKDKIIACVSSALASTIADTQVSGLQTADGVTLSSLMSSLNASLRETLLEMGSSEAEADDVKEEDKVLEDVDEWESAEEAAPKAAPKPQTDYERLLRELELQELTPVRIALRLPVWANATLTNKAAEALFKAGVTAEQMVQGNYPEPIVASFTQFLQGALSRV